MSVASASMIYHRTASISYKIECIDCHFASKQFVLSELLIPINQLVQGAGAFRLSRSYPRSKVNVRLFTDLEGYHWKVTEAAGSAITVHQTPGWLSGDGLL